MTYEQWLAALCIWREARGQSLEAMRAIWWVIKNRSTDPLSRWPRSIIGVILQHAQFSSFSVGDPNSVLFPVPPINGARVAGDWNAWTFCQMAVTGQPSEQVADPTNGANHYEGFPRPMVGLPRWADPEKITATVGPFRFYKL